MPEVNVFLLAAGLGTRLRPLTYQYPKPCIPFLNVPMGLYQFRYLEQLKINTCVANSFYLSEQIERLYQAQPYFSEKIMISNEGNKILGSAGGLKKASRLISEGETILMMNADEVFFSEDKFFLQKAYQQHIENGNLATLIVIKHPEAGKKFGAICVEGQTVKNIAKKNDDLNLISYHYVGIMFCNLKIISKIPEDVETNIFYDILINELQNNSVEIYNLESCDWYETGNGLDYLQATQKRLSFLGTSKAKSEDFLKFVNKYDPSRLVENENGISLISNRIDVEPIKLSGFNVISGCTELNKLNSLNKIENSILFKNEILNLDYFSGCSMPKEK